MKKEEYEVSLPKGSGRAGFLKAMEAILKLPRVQEIHVDTSGKITCSRLLLPNENPAHIEIDFSSIGPYSVIRNSLVVELLLEKGDSAPMAAAKMFSMVSAARLYPIAFVAGVNTSLWKWFSDSTGIHPPIMSEDEEFMGFQVLRDKAIEDYMLFLCAGSFRNAELSETYRAIKVVMPEVL